MSTASRKSEKGQAVVLLVLAMVVLLGFAALAIDGSMVYSDRRFAQDGADASSLAGGAVGAEVLDDSGIFDSNWSTNASCSSGNVAPAAVAARAAAVDRSADNDALFDQDISDNDGVETACGIETITAPVVGGGTYTTYVGHYMDVHTLVTRDTKTSFAHFVFKGLMRNTVEAVTRIRPRQPAAYGYAIVALNDANCSGNSNGSQMRGLGGSGNLTVTGGGIFSNGCMDVDGNVDVTVNNGSVAYFYTSNNNDLDDLVINNPTNSNPDSPTQLVADGSNRIPQSAYDLPMPNCNAAGAHNNVNQAYLQSHQPLSGLYCVDGGLNINNSQESLTGTDVTLVFRGGGVTINGGTIDLISPPRGYTGSAIPGVLIYMPRQYYNCNNPAHPTNKLQINGNAGNNFTGSIIAPCSTIELNGNAENFAFNSQVIGYNVDIGGSSGTQVVYDGDRQHMRPAFLDFYR